jgi:hypothetical protein
VSALGRALAVYRRPLTLRLSGRPRRCGGHNTAASIVVGGVCYRLRAKKGNRLLKRVFFYQSAHCAVVHHETSKGLLPAEALRGEEAYPQTSSV